MTEVPTIPNIESLEIHKKEWDSYEQLYETFTWDLPEQINIAEYICDRWAPDKSRVAFFYEDKDGNSETYTFWKVKRLTNRLANYLEDQGVGVGDRVAINTPQKPVTAIAHIATWKLGAVSVPLSTMFGPDALEYRINDAGAKAVIVDEMSVEAMRSAETPEVETTLTVGDVETRSDERDFREGIEGYSHEYTLHPTSGDDNAIIIYTSGTTGSPKGVLHDHHAFLGHFNGFVSGVCNLEINENDVYWTPAEWSWIATVMASMGPTLYHGMPMVAYHDPGSFDPEKAFEILAKYGVTVSFMPPTALRMMQNNDDVAEQYDLGDVRVLNSGGESLGESIVEWGEETFDGVTMHEVYGQTEANTLVEECTALYPRRENRVGKPMVGHEIEILDPETAEPTVETDEVGEIGVRYDPDPITFKEYWNNPEKTAEKVKNGWLRTGDLGRQDEDGYVEFVGRKDDVIICSGFRIGPEEIEETLAKHDQVLESAVIGVPDEERGEVPKAFVVTNGEPTDALASELQQFVKNNLAKYEYPREIEFVEELPKTVTGKIQRRKLREHEGIAS